MIKPVAIVKKYSISGVDNFHVELLERLAEGTELYIHPTKLTNEDCQKLEELMGEYWDISYREATKGISLSAHANDCLNRFRAILRKAQEK